MFRQIGMPIDVTIDIAIIYVNRYSYVCRHKKAHLGDGLKVGDSNYRLRR